MADRICTTVVVYLPSYTKKSQEPRIESATAVARIMTKTLDQAPRERIDCCVPRLAVLQTHPARIL
jgi:hypothetical protein